MFNPMHGDVRITAAILAAIGAAAGMLLPAWVLGIATVAIVVASIRGVLVTAADAPVGTSGALGAFILIAGSAICLLVPMWVAYCCRLLGG